MKKIIIIGGGTYSYVRNHLALCAPAFGSTAVQLASLVFEDRKANYIIETHLTKMADPRSSLVTNADISRLIDRLISDEDVKIIFFNPALCDYDGQVGSVASGSHAARLKTADGEKIMRLTPADKLLKRIRKERKDIFLVAFKTTTGATVQEQYIAGLNLLKANSCNLVLANDTVTRTNMVVVPEEAKYAVSTDRAFVLQALWDITKRRASLTYTRSTVVPGDFIAWDSDEIPAALREVVNHCIKRGAYKPFRGSTAGHFAVKVGDETFFTSRRKTNYNELDKLGLVKVVSAGPNIVTAFGDKPSVGGQSQRIVFHEHPDYDCIVHFHSPMKEHSKVSTREQRWVECGSHECGKNTSTGLQAVDEDIKAVFLDNHGPNIVFKRTADPSRVIDFIERNFDLTAKTGGLVA